MDLSSNENQEKEVGILENNPETAKTAELPQNLKKDGLKKFFLGLGLGVLSVVILAAVIFGVGIYRFGWSGEIVAKITKVAPYPAVFVNWRMIGYYDYADDVETLKTFFASQGEDLGAAIPDDKEIKKQVLDRLVKNELSYQLAKKYGIKIYDEDLEKEIQNIVDQSESRESVEQTLEEQYGWGIEEFKEKVLKPFLVQQKLQEAISKDETLNQEAKKKAEDVLAEIKKGEKSFEDLAKEYGEDATAEDGGDLGYFGKGTMVKEFETAAFSLGVGETSSLVLTEYGYHVIKVTEQIKDEAGEVSEVRASHILIRTKSLDDFLTEELEKARVWQCVKL
ncbi:MAG: peptidylprolyl isomerase [Patescibacteria group bacterium]